MMSRNSWFNFATGTNSNAPGIRPTVDKLSRFNLIVPMFKMGKMFFPEEMKDSNVLKEGLAEIRLATQSGLKGKDDFLDTISMLSLLNTFRPSETVDYNESRGVFNLADYDDDSTSGNINSYIV